jgi:hypothetical protein
MNLKRFGILTALVLGLSASAFAQDKEPAAYAGKNQTVIDARGIVHGTGYLGQGTPHGAISWLPIVRRSFPESYDLRALGLVGSVKNQGACGSCWAFSVTDAFTSAAMKAGHPEYDLSEQEMVSCEAYGCNGGMMDDMEHVVAKGLPSEADWPYTATTGRCNKNPPRVVQGTKWGYCGSSSRAPTLDELKQCLMDFGALSAEVAAGAGFSPDGQGFIKTCSSRSINHMVTVAGWLAGDYLILKNSWGKTWGDKGFAYTKLGCNKYGNLVSWVQVPGVGPQIPDIRLPSRVEVQAGTEIGLGKRAAQPGVVYSWYADGGLLPDTTSYIFVTPTKDTVYKVIAKTRSGQAESTVEVKVTAPTIH